MQETRNETRTRRGHARCVYIALGGNREMNGDNGAHEPNMQNETFGTTEDQEITLTFSYEPQSTMDELFDISEEQLFAAFDAALVRVGVLDSVEVSVLITTDEGIRTLNREYRGKDEATDVLSFPLLDEPLVDAPADQLWPAPEEDDAEATDEQVDLEDEDFSEEFAEDEGAEQQPQGVSALLGDEDGEADDDEEEFWSTHLGDIAISRETALRQAQAAGHSVAYEVAFLFVHGVLHLVGFDDHTDAGYQAMVAHQEAALAEAGVTR